MLDKNYKNLKIELGDNMKLRNEIPEKYKWDINIYKNPEEIENVIKSISYLTEDVKNYYGKFNNPDMFFEYSLKNAKTLIEIEKLCHYIGNSLSVDGSNTEMKKLSERVSIEFAKYDKAAYFVNPQISKLSTKYLKELLNDPRSKDLNNEINEIITSKKHKIDEKTSSVIASLNKSFSNSSSVYDIFTDMEQPFEDAINSNDEKHPVTNSNYGELITSQDRKLRETGYNSTMNSFRKFNQTFAELYIQDIKHDIDFTRLHKFNSKIEDVLFNYVPRSVFDNNIKYVNENIPVLQEFVKTLNKDSNLENFAYYDLFVNDKLSTNISIEEGQELILKALAPLGEEYLNMVKTKLNDKSIDYLPNKDKTGGAYCSGCYGAKTVILMNWMNNFDSVSTLIHEMGHCINTEYYNKCQPYQKASISIFCAEIASTVNEILLNMYMQKTCKPEERKFYVKEFLDSVRSTIFRQTLFTEFELYAHECIENDIPITNEELNNKYYELNKKYYGESCVLPENLKYEWSRIPHFYRPYYVFCYSTGLLTAISIAQKILNDENYTEKYIHFLKNGTDKKPIEILKEIDIDLTKKSAFENAFKFIKEQVEIYNSLCK